MSDPRATTLLTRHFFRRFLDNDLISPNGDSHVGISHVVAALVCPGLLVSIGIMFKYALYRATWADVAALTPEDALLMISLSMMVSGAGATVTWDAFFLEPRDVHVLGVLPVTAAQLTAAKLAALGRFIGLFVAAL